MKLLANMSTSGLDAAVVIDCFLGLFGAARQTGDLCRKIFIPAKNGSEL